jgi:hypothetical protein
MAMQYASAIGVGTLRAERHRGAGARYSRRMSHDAVKVVCEHIEAFRHDDVPAAFALLDTGVIVHTTHISGSFGAVSRGHEGVVREVRRFMGAFDDYAFEVERMSDLAARLWLW